MSSPLQVDLCVIGAGSGGLSVASGAVQLGFDVALIEKGKMGGDCLNTGCVPSKSLLAAAKAAQTFRLSSDFGIMAQEPDIDFTKVMEHVHGVISRIEPHDSQERFEGMGVKVFRAAAEFISRDTVRAGDQEIRAKYFVIATGSRASVPPIEGLEPDKVLTNENIFNQDKLPEHLVIIGGGPIGVEMAQAHRRLGSEVTIIDMGPILVNDDPELTEFVREHLLEEGIRIIEGAQIIKVMHNHEGENGVRVRIKKDDDFDVIRGSDLLVAAGRKPNLEGLELEKAGIEYDRQGIKTDQNLRTGNKKIFAIGDIAGGPQFTHIAGYHAGIVIKNMMFKIPAKVNYSSLPWVTYTDPELANSGLTEKQARNKYGDNIHVIKWSLKDNDRATAERRNGGMIKVITRKNGKIIGAAIVAPHAGELIGSWILAISQGMKIGAFANMIAPYPTLGEISKRAGSAYYTPSLFSKRTRNLISWLQKLPL